jgi:Secretion system C-terminal sorting domain
MKKIIFILICFNVRFLYAQDVNCAQETVPTSTDWRKFQAGNRNYANNWNWTLPQAIHPVYLNDRLTSPSFYVELPYFCSNALGGGSCGNSNTFQYELLEANNQKQDIYPEDGWELLIKNFGAPDAGSVLGKGVPNPYFILYNRINGKMKVYYAIVGKREQNSGYLQISFKDKSIKRAVFTTAEPVAQVLRRFHPQNQFKILNNFARMTTDISYYWLVGEIQTAYDPCTCNNSDGQASVVLQPYLATVTTIEAKIEGQLIQKLADAGQVKSESNGKTSAGAAGQKSYTQFEGYRKQTTDFLDGRNNTYKEKLTREWWNAQGGNQQYSLNQIDEKFKEFMKYDDNAKKLWGIDAIDKYTKVLGITKTIAGAVPYVATALSLIDFFSNGGKSTTTTTSAPIVFDSNLRLSGELTTPQLQPDVAFDLPGSRPSNNSSLNTFYNRTLGVFNILKEPDMEFFELKPARVDVLNRVLGRNQCSLNWDEFGAGYLMAQKQSPKQLRLKEDVKYVVNPNANLEVEMIDACFVLEYNNTQKLYMPSPTAYDTTAALPLHSQISVPDSTKAQQNLTWQQRVKLIEESGWDLEYVSNDYPKGVGSFIRFRTKYMPLQCLKNLDFILWGGKIPKMYLKMLVKMKRKDVAAAEGVTTILTYNISKSFAEATKNSLEGSVDLALLAQSATFNELCCFHCGSLTTTYQKLDSFVYTSNSNNFVINTLPIKNPYYVYPSNLLYISDGKPSKVQVSGDIVIPDNARVDAGDTIKVLGRITVGKNVTFGNNVQLIAGKSIDANMDVLITAGVSMSIEPSDAIALFKCTNDNIAALQATASEIYGATGICQSKIYKDSVNTLSKVRDDLPIMKSLAPFEARIDCMPNPFDNFLTINYDLNQTEWVDITMSNSLGQLVKTIVYQTVEAGNHQVHIPTENLVTGTYFITLRTKAGVQTKKVMK